MLDNTMPESMLLSLYLLPLMASNNAFAGQQAGRQASRTRHTDQRETESGQTDQ